MGRNNRVALIAAAVVAGMVGLTFASVPLYDLFCRVTGYGGTTQRAEAPPPVNDGGGPALRQVTVDFDTNVARNLPWTFTAPDRVKLPLGETVTVNFHAVNNGDAPMVGTATFNVTPQSAGSYFVKLECFCFTEQVLQPGQSVEMPVLFYVDPELNNDPETAGLANLTLSYSFFRVTDPQQIAAAMQRAAAAAAEGASGT